MSESIINKQEQKDLQEALDTSKFEHDLAI